MVTTELIKAIQNGEYDERFSRIYTDIDSAKKRFTAAVGEFEKLYGALDCELFSVPGRSEVLGNHTDHNGGCVLASSVSVDIIAVAAKMNDKKIRIKSHGFDEDVCDISDLSVNEAETGRSLSLIRGVCKGFEDNGFNIGGFCAYTTSDVAKGSGLSSSAAFEDMVGNILSHFYNDGEVSAVKIAEISRFAENVYYGKPCGLMDQVACAYGGFVYIDFKTSPPVIEQKEFAPDTFGYVMCIVNTFGSLAGLDNDYAAIPGEMKSVAKYLGGNILADVSEEDFYEKLPEIKKSCGDRAVMRAVHFYDECKRVKGMKKALENNDIDAFLGFENASCNSSELYLQNIYPQHNPENQGIALGLCLTRKLLEGEKYSARVHGGGFAGTIQVFLPKEKAEEYKNQMDRVFGDGACAVLNIRKYGAVKI